MARLRDWNQKMRLKIRNAGKKLRASARKPFHGDHLKKPEYFRRLICAKLGPENYDEFLSTLQALGFRKLRYEFFTKRKAFVMFSRDIDEAYRLHLRVYDLDLAIYVLAHKEPKTADISFHVKGFAARLKDFFKRYGASEEGFEAAKKELADYQAGTNYFKDLITQKVPNLAKKIDFEITEEDVRAFSAKYGDIDHLGTGDLILENLLDAADAEFEVHLDAMKDVFTILGFRVENVDLVDPKREFTAKAVYSEDPYDILVTQAPPDPDYLDKLRDAAKTTGHKFTFLLYVTPDVPANPEFGRAAHKARINILIVQDLAVFFLEHLDYPFTQEDIRQLFSTGGGLVPASRVLEIVKGKKNAEKIFDHSLLVFETLRGAGSFLSAKEIGNMLKRKDRGVAPSKEDVEAILSFLANPLIHLVERKKDKFCAVLNPGEVSLKLKKLEETFKHLKTR
ncbi:MAG: hypothetical protein ACTSU5_12500 [Promethearchaeota archaeon]